MRKRNPEVQDILKKSSNLLQLNYFLILSDHFTIKESFNKMLDTALFDVRKVYDLQGKKNLVAQLNNTITKATDNFLVDPLAEEIFLNTSKIYIAILYMKLLWKEPFNDRDIKKSTFKITIRTLPNTYL